MSVVSGLYLVLLAAVAGYILIGRVPSLLHTPMLSGSNFIHGIVLGGAMLALSSASGTLELVIGFVAVTAAAANVVGGFIVTDRMLQLFEKSGTRRATSLSSDGREPAGSNADGRSGGAGEQGGNAGAAAVSRSNFRDNQ